MTDETALVAALDALVAAAGTFAKLATEEFRLGTPKAFKIFSEAFVAGMVELHVDIQLRADGSAAAARVLARSPDGRTTTLASVIA